MSNIFIFFLYTGNTAKFGGSKHQFPIWTEMISGNYLFPETNCGLFSSKNFLQCLYQLLWSPFCLRSPVTRCFQNEGTWFPTLRWTWGLVLLQFPFLNQFNKLTDCISHWFWSYLNMSNCFTFWNIQHLFSKGWSEGLESWEWRKQKI